MSNLRQIGAATQMYMNDNNGVLFSRRLMHVAIGIMPTIPNCIKSTSRQLERFPSRLSTKRPRPELSADATTAVSYGINANILPA